MTHPVRLATPRDLDAAALVLAAAFDSYTWTRWVLPEDGYAERLLDVQRLYLAHALEHGFIAVDQHVRAVAAFLPPDAPAPDDHTQQLVAALHGPRLAVLAGLCLPPAAAGSWTLETLGVSPSSQGGGLGSAVLGRGLELIDEQGGAVSLETSDARNVGFYRCHGFTADATTEIQDGPIVYSMHRPAM